MRSVVRKPKISAVSARPPRALRVDGPCRTEADYWLGGFVQLFVAERVTPALSQADLHAIHSLLVNASRRLSGSGTPVQLLRSTYLPGKRLWMGTFTASGAESVHRAVEIAQLPIVQLSEAIELTD